MGKVVGGMSDKMLGVHLQEEGKRFVLIGCGGVLLPKMLIEKVNLAHPWLK